MYDLNDYRSFNFGRKMPTAFNLDKPLARMRRIGQKFLDMTI